jgi:hypothetical protein
MCSEIVERVARALAKRHYRWEGMTEDGRQAYLDDARAAIQAILGHAIDLHRRSTPSTTLRA